MEWVGLAQYTYTRDRMGSEWSNTSHKSHDVPLSLRSLAMLHM